MMTDLMYLLYSYAQEAGCSAHLNTPDYREVTALTARLSRSLQASLPADAEDLLEKYQDAMEERHALELEALFLAVMALNRELR